jgi:hypothetical protein
MTFLKKIKCSAAVQQQKQDFGDYNCKFPRDKKHLRVKQVRMLA